MLEKDRDRKPQKFSGTDPWIRAGQILLFVLIVLLLILHTLQAQLATWGRFPLIIDNTTALLLVLLALAALLPKVEKIAITKEGAEVDMEPTKDAVQEAQKAADATNTPLPGEQKSLALTEAKEDPLTSIELSRRRLAQALTDLARTRGVPIGGRTMTELATALRDGGDIDASTAGAIHTLAEILQAAQQGGQVTEAYALNVDYATSTIVAILRKLEEATPDRDDTAAQMP